MERIAKYASLAREYGLRVEALFAGLRETNQRLNRRVQNAESELAAKVKEDEGKSFGRYISELTQARGENLALRRERDLVVANSLTEEEKQFITDGLLLHAPGWRIPDELSVKLRAISGELNSKGTGA